MRITGLHWTVAWTVAFLLHGGVLAAAFLEPEDPGAEAPGFGGLEISLGPAGAAPGVIQAAEQEPPEAEEVKAEEITAEEVPREEPVTDEPEPVETVEVEPDIIETLPEPEVAAPEPVETVLLVAETKETVRERKLAEVTPPKRPKPAKKQPPPAPRKELEEKQVEKPVEVSNLPPSMAGGGGRAGTEDGREAGAGDNTQGGGMPGHTADYLASLQAWLEKHKKYPARARSRRQEGTALLYFVMDRGGNVKEARLKKSSGYRLLDREVMKMIKRAQPLPHMPADMTEARLELVVPVQFNLR